MICFERDNLNLTEIGNGRMYDFCRKIFQKSKIYGIAWNSKPIPWDWPKIKRLLEVQSMENSSKRWFSGLSRSTLVTLISFSHHDANYLFAMKLSPHLSFYALILFDIRFSSFFFLLIFLTSRNSNRWTTR